MSINPQYERTEPFCDKFTVTTPKDNESLVVENFEAFFQSFYAERANESCYRSASNGSLTWGHRGGVTWYTTSGSFLADLRAAKLLSDYLCCFASHPINPQLEHRVTLVDVTVDEYRYAPTAIQSALAKGLCGDIKYTRKSVSPHDVRTNFGLCQYDDSGLLTGTVYFGAYKARVRSKLYDKRQQMLQVKGVEVRDTLRHEQTVKGEMGLSLHDVASPKSLFYHFYPNNLLSKALCPPWSPSEGGYSLERRTILPAMRLKTRVQSSLEVDALLKLARLSGEHGIDYLCRLIRDRYADESGLVC